MTTSVPWLRCTLVLAAASALPSPAWASTVATQQFPSDAVVQRILEERVAGGGTMAVVVGLLDEDGTTRVFHAGAVGAGTGPVGEASFFRIGSLSNVITGTLLADMAHRGEASPDDPVAWYIPEGFTLASRHDVSITLADLATHRSGLPLDADAEVALLGELLAERLGLGWEEAVRLRVLEPLGMTMTGVQPDEGGSPAAVRGSEPARARGLHSTAEDLLRFLAANVGEPRTDLQRAMRVAHHPRARVDEQWTVGLTWMVRAVADRRLVWHEGGAEDHRVFLGFDPDRGMGVVVLADSGTGLNDLGFHLLDARIPLEASASQVLEGPGISDAELMGDPRTVLERYRTLSRRAGIRVRPPEERVQRVVDSLVASGDAPEVAFRLLTLNLWLHPDSHLTTRRMADALAARGAWDLAARHYERALVLKPGDPGSVAGLGAARRGGH